MRNFLDLRVWQEAHQLTLAVYRLTKAFPKEEQYGLTSQLRRSSASIGANLAEGCGRRSDGELSRFVQIAMGSASELAYHLILCRDLHLLTAAEHQHLEASLTRVRRMLSSLFAAIQSGGVSNQIQSRTSKQAIANTGSVQAKSQKPIAKSATASTR